MPTLASRPLAPTKPLDFRFVSTIAFAKIRFGIELLSAATRRALTIVTRDKTDSAKARVPVLNSWHKTTN